MWVQGPSRFLFEILDLFNKYELDLKCVVMGTEDLLERAGAREGIFWNKLEHQEVGSVSDSVMVIGTFFLQPTLTWSGQTHVRRTLGHVLKPVLFGPRIRDKKICWDECLNKDSVVTCNSGLLSGWVDSETIIKKERVKRILSSEELCGIFD